MRKNALATRCWRLPKWMAPAFRGLYYLHFAIGDALRWAYRVFYANPVFRARCDAAGKDFRLAKLPVILGHAHIVLGANVRFRGPFGVGSGRVFDRPELTIGNGVEMGPDILIALNQTVRFDNGARIGGGCRFMDTDGHPRDAAQRAAGMPPPPEEIKPVHICENAAIGRGSFVLKGVTIGSGATIGMNSVVVADVPPYAVAAGNPARILHRTPPPTPSPS